MNAMSEQFRVYEEDEEERVQRQEQIPSSSEEGYAPALQRLVSDFSSLSSWMQTMYSSFEQLLCYHPSRVVMQYE
jgi:hypothetical protein